MFIALRPRAVWRDWGRLIHAGAFGGEGWRMAALFVGPHPPPTGRCVLGHCGLAGRVVKRGELSLSQSDVTGWIGRRRPCAGVDSRHAIGWGQLLRGAWNGVLWASGMCWVSGRSLFSGNEVSFSTSGKAEVGEWLAGCNYPGTAEECLGIRPPPPPPRVNDKFRPPPPSLKKKKIVETFS